MPETPPAAPERSPLLVVTGVVCLLVLGLIYLGPVHEKLAALGYEADSFARRYLAVFTLGAAIGLMELLLRYQDEPIAAATSPPGLLFVLLNGAVASLALFLFEYFGARPTPPGADPAQISDTVQRVIICGLGAMVVLRGRLLKVGEQGGPQTEIGFAPLVEAILAAVNRAIDRGRAVDRMALVTGEARAMPPLTFREVAPFLRAGLQSLQALDVKVIEKVRKEIDDLDKSALPDGVRFEAAGYELLNNFGDDAFRRLFREARISARLHKDSGAAGAATLAGGAATQPGAGAATQPGAGDPGDSIVGS